MFAPDPVDDEVADSTVTSTGTAAVTTTPSAETSENDISDDADIITITSDAVTNSSSSSSSSSSVVISGTRSANSTSVAASTSASDGSNNNNSGSGAIASTKDTSSTSIATSTIASNDSSSSSSSGPIASTANLSGTSVNASTGARNDDISDGSAPIVLNAQAILINDIVVDGEEMTDGCGMVSRTLMRLIRDNYMKTLRLKSDGYNSACAFQARFGPCKGVFVEWPDNVIAQQLRKVGQTSLPKARGESPPLHLLVRDSQKKYNLPNPDHQQCAVEILSIAKPSNSAYLSQMYVPLLWQRGVETSTLEELAREAFVHHVERIVTDETFTLSSILRAQQQWRDSMRACNPHYNAMDEEPWDPPHWIMAGMMREGGFSAATDPLLAQQILRHSKQKLLRFFSENRIPMARSRSLLMVPDECGVLEPDECFIQLSAPPDRKSWVNLSSDDEEAADMGSTSAARNLPWDFSGILSGPIVALRSPSYHHSDLVRLKAVDRPLLRQHLGHLHDVIVLSTKKLGDRSPAAVMSGGDFDGDRVGVIILRFLMIVTGLQAIMIEF